MDLTAALYADASPFDLSHPAAFEHWRDQKLKDYPTALEDLIVEIKDPRQLSTAEQQEILRLCAKTNMAIYAGNSGNDSDKSIVKKLGLQFGLRRLDDNMCADEDAITSLKVVSEHPRRGYIPYTNRPIAWHTDGYYNTLDHQIRGFILHCVQTADAGGDNDLMDHEILYMMLRERNPDFICALSHPEAMTIPANIVDGRQIRRAQPGPVFSVYPDGKLHMRYTARTRSIEWRSDPLTREAVDCLVDTLKNEQAYQFHGKLQPGQGVIGNNVLHTRSGFTNGAHERLLYRARYYDRMAGT